MNRNTRGEAAKGQRRFVRIPLTGRVDYRYGAGETGRAEYADVSRSGIGLRLGRYLRPGRRVMLTVDTAPEADRDGTGSELKAQVAWCRPGKEAHTFDAGLRVFHDEVDSMVVVRSLVVRALRQLSSLMVAAKPIPECRAAVERAESGARPQPFTRLICVVGTVSTVCTVITAGHWLH